MNSDTSATSRFVNAIVPQSRLVACLEVMLNNRPALESATWSGSCPDRSTVTWSRAWSKAQSNSGQMVGQIVGQMVGQIVKWSANYAPPAGYLPASKYARKPSGEEGKKGEK